MSRSTMTVARFMGIAACAIAPLVANAFDGRINFTGSVNSQTCQINGATPPVVSEVVLPPVVTADLAGGNAAGRTPFQIALSNCGATPPNSAHLYFEPNNGDVNPATGNLSNTGTATNVEIRLLNNDATNTKIVLGVPDATQNSQTVDLSSGTATLNYFAEYVGTTGGAGAGTVISTVTYTVAYQ